MYADYLIKQAEAKWRNPKALASILRRTQRYPVVSFDHLTNLSRAKGILRSGHPPVGAPSLNTGLTSALDGLDWKAYNSAIPGAGRSTTGTLKDLLSRRNKNPYIYRGHSTVDPFINNAGVAKSVHATPFPKNPGYGRHPSTRTSIISVFNPSKRQAYTHDYGIERGVAGTTARQSRFINGTNPARQKPYLGDVRGNFYETLVNPKDNKLVGSFGTRVTNNGKIQAVPLTNKSRNIFNNIAHSISRADDRLKRPLDPTFTTRTTPSVIRESVRANASRARLGVRNGVQDVKFRYAMNKAQRTIRNMEESVARRVQSTTAPIIRTGVANAATATRPMMTAGVKSFGEVSGITPAVNALKAVPNQLRYGVPLAGQAIKTGIQTASPYLGHAAKLAGPSIIGGALLDSGRRFGVAAGKDLNNISSRFPGMNGQTITEAWGGTPDKGGILSPMFDGLNDHRQKPKAAPTTQPYNPYKY